MPRPPGTPRTTTKHDTANTPDLSVSTVSAVPALCLDASPFEPCADAPTQLATCTSCGVVQLPAREGYTLSVATGNGLLSSIASCCRSMRRTASISGTRGECAHMVHGFRLRHGRHWSKIRVRLVHRTRRVDAVVGTLAELARVEQTCTCIVWWRSVKGRGTQHNEIPHKPCYTWGENKCVARTVGRKTWATAKRNRCEPGAKLGQRVDGARG